jgi:hypothetical protein
MKLFSMFGALSPISFIKITLKKPMFSTLSTSRVLRFRNTRDAQTRNNRSRVYQDGA